MKNQKGVGTGGGRHRAWAAVLACAVWLIVLAAAPRAQDYRPGELVVALRAGVDLDLVALLHGLVPLEQLPGTRIWRVRALLPLQETLALLLADRGIQFAELNYMLATPEAEQQSMAFLDQERPPYVAGQSPAGYYGQPAAGRLQVRAAQAIAAGQDITVAVIDTGVSAGHPALAGALAAGWDFIASDDDPADEPGGIGHGHGTFIAGLIRLAAPLAMVLPLRALDANGRGDIFTIAKAIRYAVDTGRAQVINLSLGLPRRAFVVDDAGAYAAAAGAVLVASAGNRGRGEPQYPAAHPYVIGVAAVDACDIKAPFSNYHEGLSTSAPGVDVYSTFPDGLFASWSGTSFAAALVSGQAALVRSARPAAGPAEVRDIIRQSADNVDELNPGYAGQLGAGRVNCRAAVRW